MALLAALLLLSGCDLLGGSGSEQARAPKTIQPPPRVLAPPESVQEARLRSWPDGIVDGDTLRVVGFDASVRLLCIDTEEVLEDEELAAAKADWGAFVRANTEEGKGPKYGTPMGNAATEFAREFFRDIEDVYVEYESPERTRGFFGRHLAFVWIKKQGDDTGWLNYNVEAVRAGMSPYFTRYGYCETYHDALLAAQSEAQAAGRGIWAKGARSYSDYPERIPRWNARADQIRTFRKTFADRPDFIELGTDTAMSDLRQRIGERVTVFGAISRYSPRGRPPKLYLSHRHREDVIIVAEAPIKFDDFNVKLDGEGFFYAEGVVGMWRGNPQIELDAKSSIHTGNRPPRP